MIQDEYSIKDYVQVIIKRRGIILTFFTIFLITVFIGTLKQTPVYRTKAVIVIEPKSPNVVAVQEVTPMGAGGYYGYKDYYETQCRLIISDTVIQKVIDRLGLADDTAPQEEQKDTFKDKAYRFFNPEYKKILVKKDIAGDLLRNLSISPIKNSQLIEISVEDHDPERAALIANTLVEEYINQNLERALNVANSAAKWLEKQIKEQREKLRQTEINLQQYREEHNIRVLPQMTSESAAEDIKLEYAKLQALLANYEERYTKKHPKIIELQAQIKSIENKIQGMGTADTDNQTMEYRGLEREVQNNKRMYELLLSRLKEIDVASTLNTNNISVIDRASVPEKPVKPDMKLNMILAVITGCIMGIGIGFLIEYLDASVKSIQDIKDKLKAHALGGIPKIIKKRKEQQEKIAYYTPFSFISEAYRQIRTEILFSPLGDNKPKTIIISSAGPQEGKTTTTANLGIVFAQNGDRVVIVDSDLRKPKIHKVFNAEQENGLGEYLTGKNDLDSIIKSTEIENLSVITAGGFISNPAEAMNSIEMERFICEIKEKFDIILFDSSPIISVTDAIILSNMVDGSILVVRQGTVPISVVLSAKQKFEKTKAVFLGVILNDLTAAHGGYYYRYYQQYSSDEQRKEKAKEIAT